MTTSRSLDDPRITDFGLFVEAGRRLSRIFEGSLHQHHGMTSVEFEAMLRIGRSPDHRMSMSHLSDQMVLTSGGVTRLIDRLSAAGFVTRVACPSDRRVHWAQLTVEGVAKIDEILETHLEELDRHFFAAMSAEERDVVIPVLDRLRTACTEH
jgi:DNA-binding MarR family transcriptional regulator